MNFLAIILATVVPLVIGFIWYNEKVFGKAWMAESGMTVEKAKTANMAKTFGLTFLFSLMLAFILQAIVIHQFHFASILSFQPGFEDPNSEPAQLLKKLMDLYGSSYRTFKHGAFHGTLAGIFIALPLVGINALFEMKSFKYIFIQVGYYTVCLALMGGILCGMQ